MSAPKPIGDFVVDTLAGYTVSLAIVAAQRCGFWDAFAPDVERVVVLDSLAHERSLERRYLRALTDFLSQHQLIEPVDASGESVRLTTLGKGLVQGGLGPFLLVAGGYGRVLNTMGDLITGTIRFDDIKANARDGAMVALGTELASRRPGGNYALALDRAAAAAAAGAPELVLDLGCGSATFLVELVRRTGSKRGIGVEVDAHACELARATLAAAGLGDRCEVIHADIRDLVRSRPDIVDHCDVVTGLFVVHEFFRAGREAAATEFRALRSLLHPTNGRLVIVDKVTDPLAAGTAHSTMKDFQLFHQFTDQRLYSRAEWQELFADSGLRTAFEKAVIAPTGDTGTVVYECMRS